MLTLFRLKEDDFEYYYEDIYTHLPKQVIQLRNEWELAVNYTKTKRKIIYYDLVNGICYPVYGGHEYEEALTKEMSIFGDLCDWIKILPNVNIFEDLLDLLNS